jgi:hypothetical protein
MRQERLAENAAARRMVKEAFGDRDESRRPSLPSRILARLRARNRD